MFLLPRILHFVLFAMLLLLHQLLKCVGVCCMRGALSDQNRFTFCSGLSQYNTHMFICKLKELRVAAVTSSLHTDHEVIPS